MQYPVSFGSWLKQRRKELKLSRTRLAQLVERSSETIRKLETDELRPSRQLAEHLAAALEIQESDQAAFILCAQADINPTLAPLYEHVSSTQRATKDLPSGGAFPVPLTPLVGRRSELAALHTLVLNPGIRLLNLVGHYGVGKTRLALHLAAKIQTAFVDGVVYIALAPLSNPAHVLPAIAQACGVSESGQQPLMHVLIEYLRPRQVLLMLDNMEHVAAAAPQITALLAAAPNLNVLITSRSRLRISGEYVWEVPPLELPPASLDNTPEELGTNPAVELFMERVRAIQQDFKLDQATAPLVATICRRLEGIPLAIELAASWSRVLPLPQLLQRLDQPLTLLTNGSIDVAPRHQSLRNAIAWSYKILSSTQQALFCRLSVFRGGCDLSAIIAIDTRSVSTSDIEMEEDHEQATLEDIAALLDHCLLRWQSGTTGEFRLTMLETLREFGLEQLERLGMLDEVSRSHAAYHLALAEKAQAHYYSPAAASWLQRLDEEYNNLRTALTWYLSQPTGGTLALRLAIALYEFWCLRGYWSEADSWFVAAIDAAEHAPPDLRALGLAFRSWLTHKLGAYEQAEALAHASLELSRGGELVQSMAVAIGTLGSVAFVRRKYASARAHFEHSLSIAQQLHTEIKLWHVMDDFTWMLIDQHDLAMAHDISQKRLVLGKRTGDKRTISYARAALGYVTEFGGNLAAARVHYLASKDMALELDDRYLLAMLSIGLGNLDMQEGQYTLAAMHYRASIARWRRLGGLNELSMVLFNLGYLSVLLGDIGTAVDSFVESAAIARELALPRGVADSIAGMAKVAQALGLMETAVRLYGAAYRAWDSYGGDAFDPVHFGDHQRSIAELQAALPAATYDTAWQAGQTLSPEEALAEAEAVAERAREQRPSSPPTSKMGFPAGLSAREVEVLQLVAQGLTNAQIAERLIVSARTVNAHLRNIYSKIDVSSRSAATRFAVQHNLV